MFNKKGATCGIEKHQNKTPHSKNKEKFSVNTRKQSRQ